MSGFDDIREQLRKLGVSLGMQSEETENKKRWPIEQVLPCEEMKTPKGPVLSVNHNFDLSYAQGDIKIHPETEFYRFLSWAKIPETQDVRLENLVFLDTETTGLSGGTGTMAFMVGVGKFTDGHFALQQFFLRNPAEEEAFLHALSLFCKDMKAVVTYNGKAFDIPILNTRHFLHRIPSPFIETYHIDLLTISRQLWRLRLNQCNLSNIEKNILGLKRKSEEIPGYLAPEFYKDYLRTGDARPLKGVFYHNQEDVVSLAALFSLIARLLENLPNEDLIHANDVFSTGRVFETMQDYDLAKKLYAQSLQIETDQNLTIHYSLKYAQMLKRNGNYTEAISVCTKAAELNSVEALIMLAKHYEHQEKNYSRAWELTQKAILLAEENNTFPEKFIQALHHRKDRIQKRLAGNK